MGRRLELTYEELSKLHGKKVRCSLCSNLIEDAKILVDKDEIYLCSNSEVADGKCYHNRLGYKYTYSITSDEYSYLDDFEFIELVDELEEHPPEQETSTPTIELLSADYLYSLGIEELKELLNRKEQELEDLKRTNRKALVEKIQGLEELIIKEKEL